MGSVLSLKLTSDPYVKKSFNMRNFTIKWLLMTAVLLLGLFSLQTSAQNTISITNVQGSESSYPYIYPETYDVDGEYYTSYSISWSGYVTFEASGYTLPFEVSLSETTGSEYHKHVIINEEPVTSSLFRVDDLAPGTYVIQIVDSSYNTGTYEQGVYIGDGGCGTLELRAEQTDLNIVSSYLIEDSNDTIKCYDFSASARIFDGNELVWESSNDYPSNTIYLSEIEVLEYNHVYEVVFTGRIDGGNCEWSTPRMEIRYVNPCENFSIEIANIQNSSLAANDGSVTLNVNTGAEGFWATVYDAEYGYYVESYSSDNYINSIEMGNLAPGSYYAEVYDYNGCRDTTEIFTIVRDCNGLQVYVERVSETYDGIVISPSVMHAVAFYNVYYDTHVDSVLVNNETIFSWEWSGNTSYGDYFNYYEDYQEFVLTAEYNGCEGTFSGACGEYVPTCGSINDMTVESASISGNNGSISNINVDHYPYTAYVFDENGNNLISSYIESASEAADFTVDGLSVGNYRIYTIAGMPDSCISFTTAYVYPDCETMQIDVEIFADDTLATPYAALIAHVTDTRTGEQVVFDDEAYEWFINGESYNGYILPSTSFETQGQLIYEYSLSVNVNGCGNTVWGTFEMPNDCNMTAEITNTTPMNLSGDEYYNYAIVSIRVSNGVAPFTINSYGPTAGWGSVYETSNIEYYMYQSEIEDTLLTLYIIDAMGCYTTVTVPEVPTCSMSATFTYNSNTDVVMNIEVEGDDYYPISIYCDNFADSFVGEATGSTFSIPENRLTAWGRYRLIAANGCTVDVRIDGDEICNMQLVSYAVSNPTSAEIENGSVTIDVAGGVAPYYGVYYKFIGDVPLYYYIATETAPIIINNLSIGEYLIAVMDVRGCEVVVPNDSTTLVLESDCQIVSYSEYSNGSVLLSINRGTAPYTITLETGETYTADTDTLTIGNITPGMHFYTIVDAKGCTEFSTIDASPANCENVPIYLSGNVVNATSLTNPNGSITLSVTGGEAPYTYYWVTGETTESISGLYPDEYWVYVNDNNGCYAGELFTVEYVPSENLFDELYIDVNYHIEVITVSTEAGPVQAPFAVAHVQAIAGVPPYTYEWNVPSTYNDQQALAIYESGAVCVNVTDNAGSEVSGCIYIELPSADQISNEIVEEVAGIVDTCINSSAIADAHVTNVELEEGTHVYHVTWVLIEKNGPVHELVVDYPVDTLATGIYAFNLYLRCNGQRAVSSFSTRLYLTGGTESVESFSVENSNVSAYPNPFNDMLNVVIDAAENDNVAINVYNVSGQMIYTTNAQVSNGSNSIEIATDNYGAGVYFINVVGNSINETIKVVK